MPSICTNRVEGPIQVMIGSTIAVRRMAPSLATRGATKVRGEMEVVHKRRTTKLQRVQVEGRWKSGLGLRKPPTTWCAGCPGIGSFPTPAQAKSKIKKIARQQQRIN